MLIQKRLFLTTTLVLLFILTNVWAIGKARLGKNTKDVMMLRQLVGNGNGVYNSAGAKTTLMKKSNHKHLCKTLSMKGFKNEARDTTMKTLAKKSGTKASSCEPNETTSISWDNVIVPYKIVAKSNPTITCAAMNANTNWNEGDLCQEYINVFLALEQRDVHLDKNILSKFLCRCTKENIGKKFVKELDLTCHGIHSTARAKLSGIAKGGNSPDFMKAFHTIKTGTTTIASKQVEPTTVDTKKEQKYNSQVNFKANTKENIFKKSMMLNKHHGGSVDNPEQPTSDTHAETENGKAPLTIQSTSYANQEHSHIRGMASNDKRVVKLSGVSEREDAETESQHVAKKRRISRYDSDKGIGVFDVNKVVNDKIDVIFF